MDWLTKGLKLEIKKVFEPRYQRKLSSEEVVELAENLIGFIEVFSQHKHRQSKKLN